MYTLCYEGLISMNGIVLAKLVGLKAAFNLKKWWNVSNVKPPVLTIGPNYLSEKQAGKGDNSPKTFTVVSIASEDQLYYLSYKITIQQGYFIAAKISFYSFFHNKSGEKEAKLIKDWDVTDQLTDGLPYCYLFSWFNKYELPFGSKIPIIYSSPQIEYNSQVITASNVSLAYNFGEALDYDKQGSFPFQAVFGMLPVKPCTISSTES